MVPASVGATLSAALASASPSSSYVRALRADLGVCGGDVGGVWCNHNVTGRGVPNKWSVEGGVVIVEVLVSVFCDVVDVLCVVLELSVEVVGVSVEVVELSDMEALQSDFGVDDDETTEEER